MNYNEILENSQIEQEKKEVIKLFLDKNVKELYKNEKNKTESEHLWKIIREFCRQYYVTRLEICKILIEFFDETCNLGLNVKEAMLQSANRKKLFETWELPMELLRKYQGITDFNKQAELVEQYGYSSKKNDLIEIRKNMEKSDYVYLGNHFKLTENALDPEYGEKSSRTKDTNTPIALTLTIAEASILIESLLVNKKIYDAKGEIDKISLKKDTYTNNYNTEVFEEIAKKFYYQLTEYRKKTC